MIRFVLRFIGLLLLALAFIFVVYDGIRSISDGGLIFTKTSYVWSVLNDSGMQSFRALVEQYTSRDTWQLVAMPVLDQPAAVISGALGILLTLLGRKKKPLIGYARD